MVLAALQFASADDFKTTRGKDYKNATISRVEPDGIVIKFSGGIVKIPFTDLSEELRRKYNYDSEAAKAFTKDVQQQQADLYWQTERIKHEQAERTAQYFKKDTVPSPIPVPQQSSRRDRVELKYDTPEQLADKAHKAARAKMFSQEEENAELAKIPPGGGLHVSLYSISIGTADPKWLTYIIGNSAGGSAGTEEGL